MAPYYAEYRTIGRDNVLRSVRRQRYTSAVQDHWICPVASNLRELRWTLESATIYIRNLL